MQSTETFVPPLDLTPLPAGGQLSSPAPAMPDLAHEDPEDHATREESFTDEFLWEGQPLEPFSLERYCAFVSQRVSMGAPTLYQALMDGAAFYPDAIRILWLCATKPAAIAQLARSPEAMQDAIHTWAAVHAPPHACAEVVTTGIRIYNASQVNRHAPRHASAPTVGLASGN